MVLTIGICLAPMNYYYMYNNLYSKGIGGFKNTNYWSSSLDNRGLIYINFSTGDEKGTIVFDSDKKQVRAIRQF